MISDVFYSPKNNSYGGILNSTFKNVSETLHKDNKIKYPVKPLQKNAEFESIKQHTHLTKSKISTKSKSGSKILTKSKSKKHKHKSKSKSKSKKSAQICVKQMHYIGSYPNVVRIDC